MIARSVHCATSRRRPGRTARRLALLAAGLLVLALAGCSSDDGAGPDTLRPEDLVPPGTAEMPQDGAPDVATDQIGLEDIVDGGWQMFTTNGFQEIVRQRYAGTVGGGPANVEVWISDQGTVSDADDLHDDYVQSVGTFIEWAGFADEAHTTLGMGNYTIIFRRDRFWSRLNITASSQDAQDLLELFATHIDDEITG
ncbi:MAG: hypothetical protein JW819_12340 [Candidatus Krumholzibacteriota bacterium]|nr:hypothetical protein [Candidatus Krumholzibacteriota bacterium]